VFLWAMASKNSDPSRRKLEWAIYCFLLLLLSWEPLPYHFVILILTAVLAVDYLTARGQSGWAGAIVAFYVFACAPYDRLYRIANPRGWASVLFFPRLVFMILLAASFLWILVANSEESFRDRIRSRSAAWAGLAFVSLTSVGCLLDLRHFARQFDNYATRVTTSVGSAISLNPVLTADSVWFGALLPQFKSHDAYFIHRLHAGSIKAYGGDGDWFHPAVTNNGAAAWAEVASKNISRVVRFDPIGAFPSRGTVTTAVNDAEEPVISAHGELLAYIREVRGRGSLWLHSPANEQREPALDRQLASPQYDVREAAFSPDLEMVFSSWQPDRYRLYTINLQSGAVVELTSVTCSARYPAISPDGTWMAFSCEGGGVWQLMALNRATSEQRQLTDSDCNSITPAWTPDSKELIYATDCGRALGITALSKLSVVR
jgi:hypothetical protein